MSEAQPPLLDPQALRERLARGEPPIIVDIRAPEEFAAGHVEGAINIPADQLAARAGAFPADACIVTVCNFGGPRSCNAAEQLRQLGHDQAIALRGGTHGWLGNKE